MDKKHLDLYLSREAEKYEMTDFYDLYDAIPNDNLRKILASLHTQLNHWFVAINNCLRITHDEEGNKINSGGYFRAQDSRDLLDVFNQLKHLKEKLHSTSYEFILANDIYDSAIRRCKRFLVNKNGSNIPEGFEPIEIEDVEPVFRLKTNIAIGQSSNIAYAVLESIGEGSYAQVFSYEDPVYHESVALKRAKTDLDNKELKRFRQEFDILKSLNSPYIVHVYVYNELKNEYTMEYMDENIYKYIARRNSDLTLKNRKGIILQICQGLKYIHSKGLLHRDISLTNVFVKHYEDVDVFKIGDFGLVKTPNSSLTSTYSEIKGSLNDPDLINVGFAKYEMCHETFALTRLCYYILTGRTNISKQKNGMIKQFWDKGTSTNRSERFQNVEQLKLFVQQITEENKEFGNG